MLRGTWPPCRSAITRIDSTTAFALVRQKLSVRR